MSNEKKLPTEAKRDLMNWWYESYQKYVDITADDEEGFITITPKDSGTGTVYGLADLGMWCTYHDYGIWASYNCVDREVQITISIK